LQVQISKIRHFKIDLNAPLTLNFDVYITNISRNQITANTLVMIEHWHNFAGGAGH